MCRKNKPVTFFWLLMLLAAGVAWGAPVTDDERVQIDLRRTTLIVSDIENSLKFYRDALGFKVIYDNWIRTPRSAGGDVLVFSLSVPSTDFYRPDRSDRSRGA